MQVSTSTDCPRARGSGRRTTRRKVTSVSPLGRVRSSAGADIRPRSTTSFRSMTATLMEQASAPLAATPRGRRELWTAVRGVDDRREVVSRSLWRGVAVRRVGTIGRRLDLTEQFGHLRLDIGIEVGADIARLVGERLLELGRVAVPVGRPVRGFSDGVGVSVGGNGLIGKRSVGSLVGELLFLDV